MNKKILAIVLSMLVLVSFVACGSGESTEAESSQAQKTDSIETQVYYDKNETINLYLNNYNNANRDAIINDDMFETYYHHGQNHDNQIIMQLGAFEVVMSDNVDFEVVVSGDADQSAYYEMFKKYARGYDLSLTNEVLDDYWTQLLDDITNNVEFDSFECYLQIYNDQIELMQLSGEIG